MGDRVKITYKSAVSILLLGVAITLSLAPFDFARFIWFRSLIAFMLFYWGVRGCNFAVRGILVQTKCPTETSADTTPGKQGFAIGVLERFLIISIILLGRYEAIAWIVAAKALARHGLQKDCSLTAECFLIGTLSSFSFALVAGLLIRLMMNI